MLKLKIWILKEKDSCERIDKVVRDILRRSLIDS